MGGSTAGRLTSSYFGGTATNLGAVGGSESHTLTAAQIPTITAATSGAVTVNSPNGRLIPALQSNGAIGPVPVASSGTLYAPYNSALNGNDWTSVTSFSTSGAVSVTSNNTSGNAHNNVQPTIIANKLLRII